MRIHTDLPDWMLQDYLSGNEDTDPNGGEPPQVDTAGAEGSDDADGSDDSDLENQNLDGLKNGIKSERSITRQTKKELKLAQTQLREAEAKLQEAADKDKSEVDKAKEGQTRAEAKVAKLAEGYKNSAIRAAVERAARDAKFVDADDAYKGIDIGELEVEQDEDDPAQVTIDPKVVKRLVEALAKKKPYLTGEAAGDGEPSGSKFSGGKGKDNKPTEDDLKNKYSALR